MNNAPARHRVVIVGGGAGGLELATRLGDRVGDVVDITLIARNRTHRAPGPIPSCLRGEEQQ